MKKRYWIAGAASAAVALKLLLRPRDVDWNTNSQTVFHNEFSRFIEVDGVRVHYQEAGVKSGPPLVLLHGFASSTLVWSKVFLRFAEIGFRVIVPDLIGFGYSSKPRNAKYTIPGQARFVERFLDRLNIDKAIVVGSSYGGAVAATCALDYPERVDRLVLVGPVTNNRPLRFNLMRLFGFRGVGDIVSPLLIGSRRLLRRRMRRVYDRHAWVMDESRVDARHRPLRAAATHRAILRTVRAWDADRIARDAHLIRQPTLLLWGDLDPEIPVMEGEDLHNELRDSRLVVFRECGHLPQEEYPESFTEVVSAFCVDVLDQSVSVAVNEV
ncbi:MAG: alpha/beta fold hydrolase [Pyrinomonadaceae bacterium]